MTREEVFKWVKETYGVEPDYPWADDNAVLRHAENRKWFGLVMNIGADRLGLKTKERVDILNVKCDPLLIGTLKNEKGFFPAYHMNKSSWITILLGDGSDDDKIKMLLDMSCRLTKPRKKRAE